MKEVFQEVYQIIILVLTIGQFFRNLWTDFHGKEAKEPSGFEGSIGSILALVIALLLLYKAGAFSTLF